MAGSKAKKKKGGWTASDWPDAGKGEVVRGFCQLHRSFWCPCANPGLYTKRRPGRIPATKMSGVVPDSVIQEAMAFGEARRGESRGANRQAITNSGGVSGAFDFEGSVGEHIVAAKFNLPKPKLNTFKGERDVGPLEVETCDFGRRLIFRPSDANQGVPLDTPYVLVHYEQSSRRYSLVGWLTLGEGLEIGEDPGWSGNPCFVVENSVLRPFDASFHAILDAWRAKHGRN